MRHIPDTTSKAPRRRWPDVVLLCIGVLAILLVLAAFFRGQDFSPGEEISSGSIEEIAASLEDTLYPPRDILLFDGRSEVVYVYVAVRNLDPDVRLEARVERAGSGSPLARLFSGIFGSEGGLRVVEGGEEQLAPSRDGVSGVVKFEVRGEEGERLPEGNYVVSVSMDGREAAVKRFVIQN